MWLSTIMTWRRKGLLTPRCEPVFKRVRMTDPPNDCKESLVLLVKDDWDHHSQRKLAKGLALSRGLLLLKPEVESSWGWMTREWFYQCATIVKLLIITSRALSSSVARKNAATTYLESVPSNEKELLNIFFLATRARINNLPRPTTFWACWITPQERLRRTFCP